MSDTFKCEGCGGEFFKEWTDEEARAEHVALFGEGYAPEDCVILCDDCFEKYKPLGTT